MTHLTALEKELAEALEGCLAQMEMMRADFESLDLEDKLDEAFKLGDKS